MSGQIKRYRGWSIHETPSDFRAYKGEGFLAAETLADIVGQIRLAGRWWAW